MTNGSGVSRGDRNRNARLSRLRSTVPVSNAIVGIDLADRKQMVVVCDHDSRVLARRTFRCKAWDLGAALDWAGDRATRAGFDGVTVACEPTGHRWRVLGELAAGRGMAFVCVQPMLSSWARKTEDLTSDKTDDKDAVLIARLTAQLRCYLPEPIDETWGRLRHLGARREALLEEHTASVQQIRDLLECVWPAALDTAKQPFKSTTWVAAMTVVVVRDGGDLARTRRLGAARFAHQVHKDVLRRGKRKPCLRIVRNLFAALSDVSGVPGHRLGALERVGWVLTDWDAARANRTLVEQRMVAVLDELDLTELVCSIKGLSAVGAAAILAETGDLRRFSSARAVVKHAGLAPRERIVGHVHRQGPAHRRRPARVAAGGVAGHLGHPAQQPGPRRPLPPPHHTRTAPAQAHPGPDRRRRCPAAPTPRDRHYRAGLGSQHRHPRHPTPPRGGADRSLSIADA
jgi:transposase